MSNVRGYRNHNSHDSSGRKKQPKRSDTTSGSAEYKSSKTPFRKRAEAAPRRSRKGYHIPT